MHCIAPTATNNRSKALPVLFERSNLFFERPHDFFERGNVFFERPHDFFKRGNVFFERPRVFFERPYGFNQCARNSALKTERGGFEPPLSCPKLDFESSAFNHSATSPENFESDSAAC